MEQDTLFSKKTLNLGGSEVDLSTPICMGIINITPDSFYGGSRSTTETGILSQAEKHLSEGALILDIGGYSSRPGANDISVREEIERVRPAIRLIKQKFSSAFLSVDTFRSEVAEAAVDEGACIVNDISGGQLDAKMFDFISRKKPTYILMHMRGTPQNMKDQTHYNDLLTELIDYFLESINRLKQLNVDNIIIDPGFGFAKTPDQSYKILKNLGIFNILKKPILAGVSRKSMIYKTLDLSAEEALNGTTILNTVALMNGANILRVHDVKPAMEVIKLINKLRS